MDIIAKYNLPKKLKGKSFSEASKCLADMFKGRNSPEDIATLNEFQNSLKMAQEEVKQIQEAKSKPQGAQHMMPDGSMMSGAEHPQAEAPSFAPGAKGDAGMPMPEQSGEQNEYNDGGGLTSLLSLFGGKKQGAQNAGGMGDLTSILSPSSGGSETGGAGGLMSMLGGAGGSGGGSGIMGGGSGGSFGKGAAGGAGGHMAAAGALMNMGQQAFGKTGIDTSGASGRVESKNETMAGITGGLAGAQAGMQYGPIGAAAGAVLGAGSSLFGAKKFNKDADKANFQADYADHNKMTNSWRKGGDMSSNKYYEGGDEENFREGKGRRELVDFGEGDLIKMYDGPFEEKGKYSIDGDLSSFGDLNMRNMSSASDVNKTDSNDTNSQKKKSFNPMEALRYAPVLSNISQLANLEGPKSPGLSRINTKYNRNNIDERAIQNLAKESAMNNKDAILSSSGGSGASARASLLANQLNAGKVQSKAYFDAELANNREDQFGQQFDNRNAMTNLQQGNRETELGLEQEAAYRQNKSDLINALGENLGGIGQEEMFKKYPELMGLGYDRRGNAVGREGYESSSNETAPQSNIQSDEQEVRGTPQSVQSRGSIGSSESESNMNAGKVNKASSGSTLARELPNEDNIDPNNNPPEENTQSNRTFNPMLEGVMELPLSGSFPQPATESEKAKSTGVNQNAAQPYVPPASNLNSDNLPVSKRKEQYLKTNVKDYYGNNVEINKDIEPQFNKALKTITDRGLELKITDSHVHKDVKIKAKERYDKNVKDFKEKGFYRNSKGTPVRSMPPRQAGAKSFHTTGKAIDLNQKDYNPNSPNFRFVKKALLDSGFKQHPKEWWHFSVGEFKD